MSALRTGIKARDRKAGPVTIIVGPMADHDAGHRGGQSTGRPAAPIGYLRESIAAGCFRAHDAGAAAALARSAWEIKQPDGTWVPDSNVRDVKFERGRATVIFADGTTGVFNRSDVRKTKKFKKDVTPVDPRDRVDGAGVIVSITR